MIIYSYKISNAILNNIGITGIIGNIAGGVVSNVSMGLNKSNRLDSRAFNAVMGNGRFKNGPGGQHETE